MEISYTLVREIESDDESTETEIEVTVDFDYTPAERGARERGTGLQLEPDWDEDAEINSIKDASGKEVDVTEEELEKITEKCIQHVHNLQEQAEIDAYEARRDDYDF